MGGKLIELGLFQVFVVLVDQGDLVWLIWDGQLIIWCVFIIVFGCVQVVLFVGGFLQVMLEGEVVLVVVVCDIICGVGWVLDLFVGCGIFILFLVEIVEVYVVEGLVVFLQVLDCGVCVVGLW